MALQMKRHPVLACAVAAFFVISGVAEAGLGIMGRKGDSFETKPVQLKQFTVARSKSQPAGQYSFKVVGTGKQGEVDVLILDDKGRQVGRTTGRTEGTCPGKPQTAGFAELGYSKNSPVKPPHARTARG
jgi:hypothetical protein